MIAIGSLLFLATFIAVLAATRMSMELLERRRILDRPTHRSSHSVPTPRGGGLAVVPVIVIAWMSIPFLVPEGPGIRDLLLASGGAAALAFLSWRDDLRGLSVKWRLSVHVLVVGLVAGFTSFPDPYFQGLVPVWLDRAAAALALLWFLNLFNFMDGIDGIAGVETASIGLGCAIVAWATGQHAWIGVLGLALAGAGFGFLRWNWHPARIFLGDVGSIPLGFLLAWLLMALAAGGAWAAALILPLYYLGDATVTIIRRATRGERIWEAHREHFYQQAARRDGGHARVSTAVAITNLVLIGLAVWSLDKPLPAVAAAILVVALFLIYLAKSGRPAK